MVNHFLDTIFTNHALERLKERKIAQSDAWYTLKHPDKTEKGKTPGAWKFWKKYGSQTIEVVAKKNEKKEWVILSCWSKEIGNNQPLFHQPNLLEKLIHQLLNRLFKKFS